MITFLRNSRNLQPEVDEIFGVVNDKGQILNVKCMDNPDDTCRGCAFENLCESSEYNRTHYVCNENDRLDGKNVIFKIIG